MRSFVKNCAVQAAPFPPEGASNVILTEEHEDLRNTIKAESAKSAVIAFSDEPLAKRVADAFNHAGGLCRTKEPF
jgi:hypothetical protein